MRVYFDANALIYAVEGPAEIKTQAFDWIDRIPVALLEPHDRA